LEGLKDYEAALGAMRAYIHLSIPSDPFLAKARSALWEWEARLGRISGIKEMPDGTLAQVQPEGAGEPPGTNSVLLSKEFLNKDQLNIEHSINKPSTKKPSDEKLMKGSSEDSVEETADKQSK